MFLRQTLCTPIQGYWDGGLKDVFDWRIDGQPKHDSAGEYVKIGSWAANFWFHVAKGKTDKLTFSYAERFLKAHTTISCTFEYMED